MTSDERPTRFRDMRPRRVGPPLCNLCAAAGKARVIKSETVRIDHLVNYHNRCQGCGFEHEHHAGPCEQCACGHPAEEEN